MSRFFGGTFIGIAMLPQDSQKSSHGGAGCYRRVKTGKTFYRPMNPVVHAHLRSILPDDPRPDEPVVLGRGSRLNVRFQELCTLAGIRAKKDAVTGEDHAWLLKDLRKTCATYYDEHVPESSIEILGHSVGGITYRHYAHRDPLAFKAIMTLPQPSAFRALLNGFDGECPCCRRPFIGNQQQIMLSNELGRVCFYVIREHRRSQTDRRRSARSIGQNQAGSTLRS